VSLDWDALSDRELAALSSAGTGDAFAAIMRRHSPSIFRLARGFSGNSEDALDLSQETFIAAHRALDRYDGERPLRTWLSAIALNKCRDWARRRAVRRLVSLPWVGEATAEALADDQAPLDEAAASRQELARVERAISELPQALREVLVLRTIEGLSQWETAQIVGITEKAVETRLYRARSKLQKILSASKG
jgi:RNA polymerase sigma factor (sigma-70 family)